MGGMSELPDCCFVNRGTGDVSIYVLTLGDRERNFQALIECILQFACELSVNLNEFVTILSMHHYCHVKAHSSL